MTTGTRSKMFGALIFWTLAASGALADEGYTIAVIGTGNMGSALGEKLAGAGHTVIYGSRDPARQKVVELVDATGGGATATTQPDAARRSDIIILAVPWSAVESLIPKLGNLSEKIIIDITTGDRQGDDGYPELDVETSTSELIQAWAPTARVVKTPFSGAATVRDPLRHGEPTVTYIAADDREAKEIVARLAIQLQFFPLDAGPLRMARTIDHLGLLYLTPMMQGRHHTWAMVPRVDTDFSCISTQGWFDPVKDAGDLARFPNLVAAERQCGDGDCSLAATYVLDYEDELEFGISIDRCVDRWRLEFEEYGGRSEDGEPVWLVLDALDVIKASPDEVIVSQTCSIGEFEDEGIVVVARDADDEWYSTIRAAWRADRKEGRWVPVEPASVRCWNESAGT